MSSRALNLLAGLVIEDGRRWGEAATDWQWADARAVLDPTGPRRHFLTRPRGGSKTGDLGGIAVACLLEQLPRLSESQAFAADRDQASRLVKAIRGFADRTPEIRGALRIDSYRVTNPQSGTSIVVEASDDASAWGGRPPLTIVDELSQWPSTPGPQRLWTAIFSALVKDPASRLAVITSAGDPAHWSYRVLEAARVSDRWRVNEVDGPVPWLDAEDLAEQRAMLTDSQYARLHLNRWMAAEDRLATVEQLRECVVLDGPLEHDPAFGYLIALDLGLKRDRTVAVVAHRDGRRIVVDRLGVWQGSRAEPVSLEAVEEWVAAAALAYGSARIVCDPWQAVGMLERLRSQGLAVQEYSFTAQSVGRLAASLFNAIRDRVVALPADDELLDELAHVRLRESSPGVFRLDHDSGRHDDRAVALALAVTMLQQEVLAPTWNLGPLLAEMSGRRHPLLDVDGPPRRGAPLWREDGRALGGPVMFDGPVEGGLPDLPDRDGWLGREW